MKKNAFQWFMAECGMILGAMCLGWALPVGSNLLPIPDFYVFLPLAVILMGLSYYYKFVKK